MLSLYFLTDVAHFDPRLAGALFCGFMLSNALCDPIVGGYWDRRKQAPGRLYYLAGISLTAALFVLSFLAIGTGTTQLVLIIVTGVAFRISFSAVDVPHNAMLAHLTAAGCSAVRLSAVRFLAVVVAYALTIQAGSLVLHSPAPPARFLMFAVMLATFGAGLFAAQLPKLDAKATGTAGATAARTSHGEPSHLRSAIAVLAGGTIVAIISGVHSKSAVYVAKGIFADPAWASTAMAYLLAGRLASMSLFLIRPQNAWCTAVLVILAVATAAASTLLLLPPNRGNYASVLFVLGFTLGCMNILCWAVLPSISGDLRKGGFRLPEAFLFGLFTSFSKVGLALSGLILGWVVWLAGWSQMTGPRDLIYSGCGVVTIIGALAAAVGFSLLLRIRPAPWNR